MCKKKIKRLAPATGNDRRHHFIGVDVCFWHKADILIALADVCFRGQSGHSFNEPQCPLMT